MGALVRETSGPTSSWRRWLPQVWIAHGPFDVDGAWFPVCQAISWARKRIRDRSARGACFTFEYFRKPRHRLEAVPPVHNVQVNAFHTMCAGVIARDTDRCGEINETSSTATI